MKIKLNMNDTVHVELTEYGKEVFKNKIYDLIGPVKPLEHCEDFQLWELFYYFGEEMYNGNPNICFVNNEIEILWK